MLNILNEQSTGQQLINLVLEYATAMNAIERDIYAQSEAEPEEDFFPAFDVRYRPVFEAYTSKKRRVYGGKAVTFGQPVKFDGIETAIESTVTLKNKSRAEVYFKTVNTFKAEYLFVLLKEAGEWKIDNAKHRWYGDEKWNPKIL